MAVMLVPQAMGYAMLAGLPPAAGLYSCTVPLIIYAVLGTSRHLSVGPVALISLLMNAQVAPLAGGDPVLYLSLAAQTALLVGVFQFLMGALRFGTVVNYLSHAVISGFASAAAILIVLSQFKHLLGIDVPTEGSAAAQVQAISANLVQSKLITLAVGGSCVLSLIASKRFLPRMPAPVLVVFLATCLTWALHLEGRGLAVVGDVPSGLPYLGIPPFRWDLMEKLAPAALTISIIGFVESISIANLIAAREGYRVSADRELSALGIANVAAAFVGAYPVTGGLSRTAVNHQAGARTQMASIVTASVVMIALLFFTPLFRFTPKAVLAALVIVSVAGLVNYPDLAHLWSVRRSDALTLLSTFCITLLFGVESGIASGVAISLGLLIHRSSHPRIVEIGLVEADGAFRDIKRFPEARRFPEVLIFRVDSELYFANMRFVEDRLRAMLVDRDVRWVIFDLSSVNDMDAVAAMTLKDWIGLFEQKGICFRFAGMKGPVKDLVQRAGWLATHVRQVSLQAVLSEIGVLDPHSTSP